MTATFDGPVLAVLATAGRALIVGEIAKLTPRGSEIGLPVVRPTFPGEYDRQPSSRMLAALPFGLTGIEYVTSVSPETWDGQLDELRAQVGRWTGNSLQVIDLSLYDYLEERRRWTQLMAFIERDAVELVSQLGSDWRQRPA